jgi:hypothetical protein
LELVVLEATKLAPTQRSPEQMVLTQLLEVHSRHLAEVKVQLGILRHQQVVRVVEVLQKVRHIPQAVQQQMQRKVSLVDQRTLLQLGITVIQLVAAVEPEALAGMHLYFYFLPARQEMVALVVLQM